jgi:hypothetical protein
MDASRVFVNKQQTFDLSAYFTKEDPLQVGRKEDIEKEDLPKWEEMTVTFQLPDYGLSKLVMRNSVDYDSGSGTLNDGAFKNNLLVYLAKKWNLVEKDSETGEEKEMPLNLEKLNELRPDITRLFVELLQEKLIEEGLYESMLLS